MSKSGKKGLHATKQFDTVVVMNVLVYSRDAFDFLETVYGSLRPGGLLIFHDRWFLDTVKSSECKTAGFEVNMIEVSKTLLDHFLSKFQHRPFLSTEQTELQIMRSRDWCGWKDDEQGYWAAVTKPVGAVEYGLAGGGIKQHGHSSNKMVGSGGAKTTSSQK